MELLLVLVCRNTQSESTGDLFTTHSTYKTKIAIAKIEYERICYVDVCLYFEYERDEAIRLFLYTFLRGQHS
jgi:hypothetical protein